MKRNKQKCNFEYAVVSMMTSQNLKFVDFPKTQKSRYLENEALFLLQIRKLINYTSRAMAKNSFVVEVAFKNNFSKYLRKLLKSTCD